MKIVEEQRSGHNVLRLQGSLKVGEPAREFSERVEKVASGGTGTLILDLSELDYLDSTGLGQLVAALQRLRGAGRDVFLVNPQRRVLSGLRVTHLDSLFRIYDDLNKALAGASATAEGNEP